VGVVFLVDDLINATEFVFADPDLIKRPPK